MSVTTTPHLNFRANARAALEFYHSVFGGQLILVSNEDAQSAETPDQAQHIKFGQVIGESGFQIMGYDVPTSLPYEQGEKSVYVSVRADSVDEITKLWNSIVSGSTIIEGLAPSFFSPAYGMVKDRFGVIWVLDVAAPIAPHKKRCARPDAGL